MFDLRLLGDHDGVRVALLVRHNSSEPVASAVNLLGTHLSEHTWRALTPLEIEQWCSLAASGDDAFSSPDVILLERAASDPVQLEPN